MRPGDIYRHDRFYRNSETSEPKRKYLVLLALTPGGDWVTRLMTSQEHGRPEVPVCYHGDPYPGYFLGVPGPPLTKKTWVDLRALVDVDPVAVRTRVNRGVMARTSNLSPGTLVSVLECAAGANDTTVRQERALRDQLALLR